MQESNLDIARMLKILHTAMKTKANQNLAEKNITGSQMDILVFIASEEAEEKEINQSEMVPSTIVIPSDKLKKELTEKVLEELVIKNISVVMKQLGEGYSFIESQYKINVGNKKNYIDLLLFNIKFNNYVVIELKAREFRKEDIGQIKLYMNYIDKEVKNITQNKTMGIIITKEINEFVIRYIKEDNIAISTFDINALDEVT